MALAPVLESETLSSIAAQLAARLTEAGYAAVQAGQQLEIGESFPIWMLGFASVANPELAERAAIPTGYWHHQIRHAGEAKEFAKSRPLGPGPRDWRVEEIVTSPIAERVNAAIATLDTEAPGDQGTRLLVIPAYFVHAFWLGTGADSRVLLIHKPDSVLGLDYGRMYGLEEFLQILSRQSPSVGIPTDTRP
jgi:hypothetical protein